LEKKLENTCKKADDTAFFLILYIKFSKSYPIFSSNFL
jgi:hypothetical protein